MSTIFVPHNRNLLCCNNSYGCKQATIYLNFNGEKNKIFYGFCFA